MSIKNKTLLFITAVLILLSFSILAVINMQQDEETKMLQKEHLEDTIALFEKVNHKYEEIYSDIVYYYFNTIDVKEAIRSRDRSLLYKLSNDTYIKLQKENPNLSIMNFYLPDSTLLLKMNQPRESYMYESRFLVDKMHTVKEVSFGFDKDKDGLAYRVMLPMFYSQEYIGVLEIGIKIDYILEDMDYYANVKGAIFEKNKLLYKTMQDSEVIEKIANLDETIQTKRGDIYSLYSFVIKNNEKISIADIHLFKNITKEVKKFNKDKNNILIFLIIVILITLIVINFGLSKSVKGLQESFDDINEHKDMINDNVMIVDTSLDGTILGVSNRFCKVSGYKQSELINKPLEIIKDPNVPEKTYKKIYETLKKDGFWNGELKNKTKDGKTYWLDAQIQAKNKDKEFICFNHIMHDITDKKINEDLLLTDELTNMYNRRYFNDLFPRSSKAVKRNGGCFNFVILDIDDFKNYNDMYGHAKGDEALIKISEVLGKSFRRPDDFCFRLGGAEFGIIFKTTNTDEGYLYAQVLRKNIEMIGIKHEGNHTYKVLTASLGLVSVISDNIDDERDIYKLAYDHMHRAKEDGRNKVIRQLV